MPKGLSKFLKPTKFCESSDPAIKKLAKEITKEDRTKKEKAISIFEWVRDNIKYKILPIVGAKKVLERKPMSAVCFDKTNLFIALCRAVGIPARYVFMDCDLKVRTDFPARANHSAAEVFINNKWIIADPTFSKDTKKLIGVSKFGKPTWTKAENIKRSEELSSVKVFIINFFLRFHPSSKKLKNALQEARGQV